MEDLDNHSISTVCHTSASRAWLWSALTADMRLQHRRFKSVFSRRFRLNPFNMKITDKSDLDIVDKSDFHTAGHFAGVHAEGKHVIHGSSHVSDDLSTLTLTFYLWDRRQRPLVVNRKLHKCWEGSAVVRHSAHAQIMRFEMNGSFCFCLLNNLKTVEIKQIQYAVLTQTDDIWPWS